MPLEHKEGDLLEANEQYIVHQTNCVSEGARGLAQVLFSRFPWANVYARRTRGSGIKDRPGSITICGDGRNRRLVVALFGQYWPGTPKQKGMDTAAKRMAYFREGLDALARLDNAESFAFPHLVGCGSAGGDWREYEPALEVFAAGVGARVVIYHLPDSSSRGVPKCGATGGKRSNGGTATGSDGSSKRPKAV